MKRQILTFLPNHWFGTERSEVRILSPRPININSRRLPPLAGYCQVKRQSAGYCGILHGCPGSLFNHRHRFPKEIISHCVWLYFRFALSFRDVEEMLAMRGVVLTYETVREWCLKFGQIYANELRRRSPRPGDRWHLDEVFLRSMGAFTIYGVQWIRTARYWIFWSRATEIRR